MQDSVEPEEEQTRRSRPLARLAVVLGLFIALYIIATATGLDDYFTQERLQGLLVNAGAWGWLLFLVAFALGELVHIPGVVFVGAATLVYTPWVSVPLAYAGALLSVVVSFGVVRKVGGTALGAIKNKWVRRALDGLDANPIKTVFVLRLLLWMAPALNYALAMTRIRFKDYLIGSALGLIIPILGLVAFLYGAMSLLG